MVVFNDLATPKLFLDFTSGTIKWHACQIKTNGPYSYNNSDWVHLQIAILGMRTFELMSCRFQKFSLCLSIGLLKISLNVLRFKLSGSFFAIGTSTIKSVTSVWVLAVLFCLHFLKHWQREFFSQLISDQILCSQDLIVLFSSDTLRRN